MREERGEREEREAEGREKAATQFLEQEEEEAKDKDSDTKKRPFFFFCYSLLLLCAAWPLASGRSVRVSWVPSAQSSRTSTSSPCSAKAAASFCVQAKMDREWEGRGPALRGLMTASYLAAATKSTTHTCAFVVVYCLFARPFCLASDPMRS